MRFTWARIRTDTRTSVSPIASDGAASFRDRSSNLVVIGAASKNCIREDYLGRGMVRLRLSNERPGVGRHQLPPDERFVQVLSPAGEVPDIRSESLTLTIVEKIHDDRFDSIVFFCVGQRGDSTWAATEYLARNWRTLEREFGSQPFALCLGFVDPGYSYDYTEPVRLDGAAT